MHRLLLPTLDVNTTHATLTAWHKRPGDPIRAGDIVAELTTDKAAFDLESPFDGTLLKILAPEKSILPTAYILALIGTPGETDPTAESENATLLEQSLADENTRPQSTEVDKNRFQSTSVDSSRPPTSSPIRATPKARRLAQLHNIDLALVHAQTSAPLIDEQTLLPFLPK